MQEETTKAEEWISVEDRLPGDDNLVLGWWVKENKPIVAYYNSYWMNPGSPVFFNEDGEGITYWRPLPLPPTSGEKYCPPQDISEVDQKAQCQKNSFQASNMQKSGEESNGQN